jgi:hypothetical protein
VAVAKEFAAFALNKERPVTRYLRALARDLNAKTPGKGVGVIGQCFTGGFALAAEEFFFHTVRGAQQHACTPANPCP